MGMKLNLKQKQKHKVKQEKVEVKVKQEILTNGFDMDNYSVGFGISNSNLILK